MTTGKCSIDDQILNFLTLTKNKCSSYKIHAITERIHDIFFGLLDSAFNGSKMKIHFFFTVNIHWKKNQRQEAN